MNEAAKLKQISTVLWIALSASPIMLLFVGYSFLFPSITDVRSENLVYIFMGVAVLQAILGKVFHIRANNNSSTAPEAQGQRLTFYILSWAMGESIAVLGLVTPLVCGVNSIQYAYSFFIAAIVLNVMHKPNFDS